MDSEGRSGGRPTGVHGSTGGTETADAVPYPKVVLVTGACRFLGGNLTARLAQNPLINHVIAVDAIAPSKDLLRRMGRAEFVRADIRNPFIAKVIRNGEVNTVVHAAAASYASSRDPVMFTEENSARRPPGGFARDSMDIEGYVRGLARRRPDIAVTILRLANMIGPAMDTALSRYLAGPVVPSVVGHDARLQLLHEQDALGALERATVAGKAGTFNVGASGIIMMSQAIRRSGRIQLPVPRSALAVVDSLNRATRYSEVDREQLNYLSYGRVMDTTRMRRDLCYSP